MPIRLVSLLNMPSVSSPNFNKIKQTSHLGKWHALSLEILTAIINLILYAKCMSAQSGNPD